MAPFSLSPISSPLLYISFFSSLPILFPIPSNSPNGNREAVKLRPITDRNLPRPYGPTYVSKQCKQKKKKRAKESKLKKTDRTTTEQRRARRDFKTELRVLPLATFAAALTVPIFPLRIASTVTWLRTAQLKHHGRHRKDALCEGSGLEWYACRYPPLWGSAHRARHLTKSADRKTRDKALDSLTLFLRSKTNLSLVDLLKLWKGLFFCTSPEARAR